MLQKQHLLKLISTTMKYITCLFIVLFTICATVKAGSPANVFIKEKNSVNDTTLAYLLSLNLDYYKGKPIDSLLAVLPANYTDRRISGWDNFFYAKMLYIRYPDSSTVLIVVKDFVHLTQRYSREMNWDFSLFRKETIFCIEIYKTGRGLLKPDEECSYE